MRIPRQLPLIALLLLFIACNRHYQSAALLARADSLMTAHPDSAYRLLDSIRDEARTSWRRADRMRYELTLAEAMNKAYKDFTTDSVLKQVVRYYDRHGSHNDQLKAHYLLGCAYRDMGEAPAAINAWQEAVDCADTTSADCDYNTLYRVYGQMADVYARQYLPVEELAAQKAHQKYALKAGDTLTYIHALLLLTDTYYSLNDTSAIFHNIETARQLYLARGMTQEAAQVYPTAIQVALDNRQFERAYSMMQIYEQQSGLFDADGNVGPEREKYYYNKGRYYLGMQQLDSAERQFRKLLSVDANIIDGYRGLLSLFKAKNDVDSTFKYAQLYEEALVNYLKNTETSATEQAKGMYDYGRQLRIAQEKEKEADKLRHKLTYTCLLATFIVFLIFTYYQKKRRDRKQLQERLDILAETLARTRQEAETLQESLTKKEATRKLITQKEEQIQKLKSMISALREETGLKPKIVRLHKEQKSDIVNTFRSISKPHTEDDGKDKKVIAARAATAREWKELERTIQHTSPDFYLFIVQHKLSDLKFKVCLLSYLGFDNKQIETLANARKGSVPNARGILAKELFGLDSAHELNTHLRKL